MAATEQRLNVSIIDSNPSSALYQVEQLAHDFPWSKAIFMQSSGDGYRWRELIYQGKTSGFTVCQQVLDELTLHNIAVAPDYQGRGLGSQLLDDVLRYAQNYDLTVFLEVRLSNTKAVQLYEKSGFVMVGRRASYYRTVAGFEDGLVMRWQRTEN
ncbi:MAG: ribosomal protein S18-alanine N-acetyltransferase [Pseudomonadota bacterium]